MVDHRFHASVTPDVTTFAIKSIDRVRDIAQAIIVSGDQAPKPGPFCRNLRSALDGVKTQLQRSKQSQDEAQLEKVKSLLRNLERLCNVRHRLLCFHCLPSVRYPKLLSVREARLALSCSGTFPLLAPCISYSAPG